MPPIPATTEQFPVRNRWTGDVQFTATIEVTPDMLPSVQLGLAVRWGRSNDAVLTGADLRGADLTGAVLRGAYLRGADLTDADLTGAVLTGADLTGADLTGVVLTGADLRGAYLRGAYLTGAVLTGADLSDCPVTIPDIHKAVYAAASEPGALDMVQWHCGTAHCRAGWVVTLAGDGGKALEWALGTPAAAALIYQASDPTLARVPDFYTDNATAMADMARLSGVEPVT